MGKWRIKLSGRYIYARFVSPRRVVQGLSFLLGMSPQIQKKKRRQKMKKILSLILVLVMLISLVSCAGTLGERGDVSIVIENLDGTYTVYKAYLEDVENRNEGTFGVIQHLMEREKNPLSADIVNSEYGAYVNAIGSLTPDTAAGEFVSVYTSLEKDFGTWDGVGTVDYEGKTLTASGVGLTSMSAEKDTVVLFRIEVYN